MRLIFFLSLCFSVSANAFLLIDPDYRLANPTDTTVNVASTTCGTNIPNDILIRAIDVAIHDFWNTVTESKLRLKVGDVVNRTTAGQVIPGEILIGCNGNTTENGGSTNPNTGNGTSIITLDAGILTTAGFDRLVWVVVHEMGHALGLTHSGDPASVMTYNVHGWGMKPEHLAQDDKNGIIYLYPIDGQAGGLIPGCSVDASAKTRSASDLLTAILQELLGMLLVIGLFKLAFSGRNWFKKKY